MNATSTSDPFQRRLPTPLALDRIVALVALLWGAAYLGWRMTDSLFDVSLVLGIPLVAAEVVVWLSFGSFLHRCWRRPSASTAGEPVKLGTIDVFVTSLNDPVDAVRATLIACHALDAPHKLWVLDDGNRPEIASLAHEHGAEYVAREQRVGARAGNVNHAMAITEGSFALWLNAGEVPMPDLFTHLAPAMADPAVGAVAAGCVERDADCAAPRLVEHTEREIVAPSLDRVDAAAWEGGPVLVRRAAHDDVGGLPDDTVAPDIGFTARLWRAGWLVRSVALPLAEVPGPANLTARLALRDRHVLGRVEVLRRPPSGLAGQKVTLHQRLGRFGVVSTAAASAARVVMAAVGVSVLLTGTLPLDIGLVEVVALVAPAFALRALAVWLLTDGRLRPLASLQHELAFMGLHLSALGRLVTGRRARYRFAPREGADPHALEMLAKVPLLTVTTLMMVAAVAYRVAVAAAGQSAIVGAELAAVLTVTGLATVVLAGETVRWAARGERRTYDRLTVEVSGRVDGAIVRILDVVGDGVGIETGQPLDLDDTVRVTLNLPDPTGAVHDLRLRACVRWTAEVGPGLHRAGLEFIGLRPIERDRLVEFASVTVPYRRMSRAAASG